MKKQIVSTLLALCMLLCLMPTAAFAESSTEPPPVCSCETACTAESMNTECPVCGAEGASAENCAKYIKPADGAAAQPEEKASDSQPEGKASDSQPEGKASDPQPEGKASDPQPEGKVSDPQPETALTALSGEGETPAASGAVTEVGNADELTKAISGSSVKTVKLARDIIISSSLTVKRAVTLDLNGFVLKYQNDSQRGSVIVVDGGGNLTLTDSNATAKHKFMPNGKLWVLDEASGTETVNGGVITGGTGKPIQYGGSGHFYYTYYGGGVYIAPGGQLTMTGGNIIGCSAAAGGGVCIDPGQTGEQSQFSMSGGSIIGCVASNSGGGVFSCTKESVFNMSGTALIHDCRCSSSGGGVHIYGTFQMSGQAVIHSCTAESETKSIYGGGVYISSSSSFVMSGEAKIEGCQAISNSSKSSNGGGVYLTNNTKFTLSGSAVIQNCTAKNSANPGGTYGGGVMAAVVKEITLADSASIAGCTAANGSGLYITGVQQSRDGKLYANGGSVDGDVVLAGNGPCTITGSGETVFKGKVTVASDSTIEKGTFNGEVINNGTITGGVFNSTVSGSGIINGGTFNGTPDRVTGSGTETAPYQIGTAEGLKWFRDKVNSAKTSDETKICVVLTADIDLKNDAWTPIGQNTGDDPKDTLAYSGTFNGNGHTISGLNVTGEFAYSGLFGYTEGAAIRDLTVAGKVTSTSTDSSTAVGGIIGRAKGSTIENCGNLCAVTAPAGHTGGIVGYAAYMDDSSGWITGCYNAGKISGGDYAGGIVGTHYDDMFIYDCYNVGAISGNCAIGGIAGSGSFVMLFNCYNAGIVVCPGGTATPGGLFGSGSGQVRNSYYLKGTTADSHIGAIEKSAEEFADGTVLKALKDGKHKSEDPWADECQYVDAAGLTLPVFNGQGDAHDHQSNDWKHNDTEHWQVCTCGVVFHKAAHSGGKATCKAKAVCEFCKASYGSLDPNNHADLKHINAKAATAAEEGNIEYWYCDGCGKYFSDAAATKEITKADTVTAKLPPKITAGDGAAVTQGEKKELSFTSDASFADFLRVDLDGTTLDEKNYTKKEGSTIITLNRDFVATLSVGEHTLSIVSKSGTATAKFTVKAKPAETTTTQPTVTPQPTAQPTQTAQPQPTVQPVSPIPSTGDTANPALWFALLIVSGFALAAIFVLRRKANRK